MIPPTSLPTNCMLGLLVTFGMWCHGAEYIPKYILKYHEIMNKLGSRMGLDFTPTNR